MPFEVDGSAPLSGIINVRVTAAEKAQLQQAAELSGLTLSSYVRRRACGRKVVAEVDATMVRELRRMGGLLKHIHSNSGGVHGGQTLETLRSIQAAIGRLGRR